MYLYGAQLQAKPGRGAEVGKALAGVRDAASTTGGRPVYAWALAAGAPLGSFVLSGRMEGLGDLTDLQARLAADDHYQKLATDLGDLLAGPVETSMSRVVATAGELGDPKPMTAVTTARISGGHYSDAMAWGNEVLEYTTGVTGMGGMFTISTAGDMGVMGWLSGADSAAALDDASAALAADPGYLALVDKGGDLVIEGSATRFVLAQLP